MSIFQKSVVNKYLKSLDEIKINQAFEQFTKFYGNLLRRMNIVTLKEENYQEGFLREIFVNVLGYTINPDIDFNLTTEYKNQTDNKKADGAILKEGNAIGVIELKSTKTLFIESITKQAFNYKNNQPNCRYVITSNFHFLRFFIDNSTEFEEFDLFELSYNEFKRFYLFLSKESVFNEIPLKLKEETKFHEESITEKFYRDYKQFKDKIFENLVKNNPQYDKLTLFKKTQKLLDRFIFIWFAEDCGLVAPNMISNTIQKWKILLQAEEYFSLFSRFQKAFHFLNVGYTIQNTVYPAFNGGLFSKDDIIDNPNLKIDDDILLNDCLKISAYDFSTELDVNILGHIFEHSLNEIEEITAELKGEILDKSKTKRKKDGIFYTPKYITQYIVDNSIGKLCKDKKKSFKIDEIEITEIHRKNNKITKQGKELFDVFKQYKNWLSNLKILDPACGSGAFLNQALEFLIEEHKEIDELIAELTGDSVKFEIDKTILENNIFGVDLNEESVEIAKLSLWLRTAKKDRTLSDLNNNIKCGNSLIDNKKIAGEKAFDWKTEFAEIMQNGGFDIIIGNPPYGVKFNEIEKNYLSKFDNIVPDFEIYIYFISLAIKNLLNSSGIMSYIIPNTFLSRLYGVKYRKNLIDNFFVNYISDLSNDNTFVDASVRTCIISISKQNINDNLTDVYLINSLSKNLEFFKQINSQQLIVNIENWLNITKSTINTDDLVTKLKKNPPLSMNFDVSQGYIPYRRSDLVKVYGDYGNEIVDKRLWHSETKLSDEYKQELLGKDVLRYCNTERNLFIKYGKNVASFVNPKFFTQPRVLLREIAEDKLVCSYFEKEFYTSSSIISVIKIDNKPLDLKYLLSIINSSLIGWYHNQTSPKAQKGLFPKILINDVRNLPVPIVPIEKQKFFIEKVDKMLQLNSQFQIKQNQFVELLQSNFDIKKITERIKEIYNFDFKELLSELKKQKSELKIDKQSDWLTYFKNYKNEMNQIQSIINETDNLIDKLVYELYQLTDEEIAIVEKTEKNGNSAAAPQ